MWRTAVILGLAASAGSAAAQDKPRTSAQFERLVQCRQIADNAERLACFDREVASLASAEAKQDVVIVDRSEVTQARRSLFGLHLPTIRLFGDGDSEVDHIDSEIAAATRVAGDRVSFTLPDGARWVQTDDRIVAVRLKPGTKVTIRRGAMGSFFAKFEGAIAVRVARQN